MFPIQSLPRLVGGNELDFALNDEKAVAAARAGVNAIAERNAVLRLLETAKVILDSMSVADQPSLHARLRSDIDALRSFGLEG